MKLLKDLTDYRKHDEEVVRVFIHVDSEDPLCCGIVMTNKKVIKIQSLSLTMFCG